MSHQIAAVHGNLALALEPLEDTPRFTVIPGAQRTVAAPQQHVPATAPVHHTRARRLLAAAVLIVLGATLLAGAWAATGGRAAARAERIAATETSVITVRTGDSLWSIAAAHGIEGLSTQETSDAIRELNDLDSALLTPGMELAVPVA